MNRVRNQIARNDDSAPLTIRNLNTGKELIIDPPANPDSQSNTQKPVPEKKLGWIKRLFR
ncbi:MAG: hypothetical protein PHP74_04215 [Candidatus Gracilibacteria bacterium]|nr:hypothetical protein [Candidatus Gracilibacteria bacterium]